jgi:hypothetical protein
MSEAPAQKPASQRKPTRKPRKAGDLPQLVMYIVVNVLVSAATMLGVLFFWDQRTPKNENLCLPTIAPAAINNEETAEPTVAAIPPLEQEVIRIEIIYGAGYLQDERVVLQRVGTSDLPLYGWWLEDENGNRFEFPAVTLKPGATLEVYSRSGDSTVLEFFWGAGRSVWEIGEAARVYDPQGNLRAEYVIP